jgi:hypothetical protein
MLVNIDFADARTPLFPDGLRMRARLVSRRVSAPSSDPNRAEVPWLVRLSQDSGVFIRGEPPNKKTTRQRTKHRSISNEPTLPTRRSQMGSIRGVGKMRD